MIGLIPEKLTDVEAFDVRGVPLPIGVPDGHRRFFVGAKRTPSIDELAAIGRLLTAMVDESDQRVAFFRIDLAPDHFVIEVDYRDRDRLLLALGWATNISEHQARAAVMAGG